MSNDGDGAGWTVGRLTSEDTPEARFAAVRVAAILARRLQAATPVASVLTDGTREALAAVPAGARTAALPEADALEAARACIRAADAQPAMAPHLRAAMEEHAASRAQLGTGILEVGVLLTVALLVAKLSIRQRPGGGWDVELLPISDPALQAVAGAVTEVAKAVQKTLDRVGPPTLGH